VRVGLLAVCVVACGRPASDERRAPAPTAAPPEAGERCDPRRARQCVGNDVVACEPDGTRGRRLQACHDGCDDGACVATCADDGARLIYLVDAADELLSFDPRKLPGDPFARVGTLACDHRASQPFSMAVDRHGVAWVIYRSGELFKVSISDARCRPTRHVRGAGGIARFGMGFVSDQAGGATETLYLSSADGSNRLARIDPAGDLTPRPIGAIAATAQLNPELTGTSDARLFGFFPAADAPSFVQEIDRATGAALGPRWSLGAAPLGQVTAWAFAQWAGVFYVFVTVRGDDGAVTTTVRTIDPASGRAEVVRDRVPYAIAGAGVSTCAPAHGE
jgi:hypothetical protein